MKIERSNVKHPLWRKKVDSSMWGHNVTTIPNWACEMWSVNSMFKGITSQRETESEVSINFNDKTWKGHITEASKGRPSPAYRLWFEEDLTYELKQVFLMSYMRDIEKNLRGKKESDVEEDIPFWEFLDIEFDEKNRKFLFVAYYTQKPTFPKLFSNIVASPKMKEIDQKIMGKSKAKIFKQDWRPIEEFHTEIGADNVVYMLLNKTEKKFYVGEAKNLIQRFSSGKYDKKWEYYRYDKLPNSLENYRLEIERASIRAFASVLKNKKDISTMNISNYSLTNSRIDK